MYNRPPAVVDANQRSGERYADSVSDPIPDKCPNHDNPGGGPQPAATQTAGNLWQQFTVMVLNQRRTFAET